jgi:hypothetical protein
VAISAAVAGQGSPDFVTPTCNPACSPISLSVVTMCQAMNPSERPSGVTRCFRLASVRAANTFFVELDSYARICSKSSIFRNKGVSSQLIIAGWKRRATGAWNAPQATPVEAMLDVDFQRSFKL